MVDPTVQDNTRGWGRWEVKGQVGGALMNGMSALIKKAPEP